MDRRNTKTVSHMWQRYLCKGKTAIASMSIVDKAEKTLK